MGNTGARRRWWRRGAADPGGDSRNGSALDDERTARRRDRLAEARATVAGWVEEQGAYDPDARAAFDPRIDALKIAWHKDDSDEHDTYLNELGRRLADSKKVVETAAGQLHQAQENRQRAWVDYIEARRRLGGELLPPAVTPNGDGGGPDRSGGPPSPPPGGVAPLRAIEPGPEGRPPNADAAGAFGPDTGGNDGSLAGEGGHPDDAAAHGHPSPADAPGGGPETADPGTPGSATKHPGVEDASKEDSR